MEACKPEPMVANVIELLAAALSQFEMLAVSHLRSSPLLLRGHRTRAMTARETESEMLNGDTIFRWMPAP